MAPAQPVPPAGPSTPSAASALHDVPLIFDDAEALLDALLYSTSHDLRSPLLTISLSAELIEEALRGGGGFSSAASALEHLRHGARDLERMLQGLTVISRARRRPIEVRPLLLSQLLAGHMVLSEADDLERVLVRFDARVARDLFAAIGGGQPLELHVAVDAVRIEVRAALADPLPDLEGHAVAALLQSLQTHAGTPIEALAGLLVQVERAGGRLAIERDAVRLVLERAKAPAA